MLLHPRGTTQGNRYAQRCQTDRLDQEKVKGSDTFIFPASVIRQYDGDLLP